MTIPNDLLDELLIDQEMFSFIYLVLTCAHNVAYPDLKENKQNKAGEVLAMIGK